MLRARSVDGFVFNEETTLTHVMPAPPAPTVNGQPMSTDCDDEEPGYAPTEVTAPVTIAWPEVTMSHPDADGGGAGVQPPVPVTIHNYGLVVEFDAENPDPQGDELEVVMEIILPPWQTEATVPEEILDLGEEFKYEVLAREESFNQTAVESCFVVVEP